MADFYADFPHLQPYRQTPLVDNSPSMQQMYDQLDSGVKNGSGVLGTSTYDPYAAQRAAETQARNETLAYLADQEGLLNNQLTRSNTTLDQGLTGIGDSYNKEVSGANTNRSRFVEDWTLKQGDSERGRSRALGQVNTNARTLAESLRRRLGMASGSDSSAYQITAPGAVARDATKNRTNVLGDYAVNFRNLDLSERRNKEDYQGLLGDLAAQRQARERGLRSDILSQQNSITESLAEIARQRAIAQGGDYTQVRTATAPLLQQIQAREAEIDGLFSKYRTPYAVKQVRTNIPELRKYLLDKTAIQANQEAGTDSPYSPYLPNLQEDEEQPIL